MRYAGHPHPGWFGGGRGDAETCAHAVALRSPCADPARAASGPHKRPPCPPRRPTLLGTSRATPADVDAADDSQQAFSESAAARLHSITSVARTNIDGGIVMPSALAVFMLRMSSKVVGCSMGKSPGLAPFKMRST